MKTLFSFVAAAAIGLNTFAVEPTDAVKGNEVSYKLGSFALNVSYASHEDLRVLCTEETLNEDCSLNNLNTRISFNENVLINGRHLFAGNYAMRVLPGAEKWEIVITDIEAKPMQKPEIRFAVTPLVSGTDASPTFNVQQTGERDMLFTLQVKNHVVPMSMSPIKTDARIEQFENATRSRNADWQTFYQAAFYCHRYGIDHPSLAAWANRAAELKDCDETRLLRNQVLALSSIK